MLMGVRRATPVFALSVIFLMSVLLLGLAGYPSSQLNSENNIDINGNFLFSFANLAHADEDDDEEKDAGQELQQEQGRSVRPMQVVQDQHQGLGLGSVL